MKTASRTLLLAVRFSNDLIRELQAEAEGVELLPDLLQRGRSAAGDEAELVHVDEQVVEPHQHVVVEIPVQPKRPDALLAAADAADRRLEGRLSDGALMPVQIEIAIADGEFPAAPIAGC